MEKYGKTAFIRVLTDGLGIYGMGGYGRMGVYRDIVCNHMLHCDPSMNIHTFCCLKRTFPTYKTQS